jgi:hypothetical protein
LACVKPKDGVVFLAGGEQLLRQNVKSGGMLVLYAVLELVDG